MGEDEPIVFIPTAPVIAMSEAEQLAAAALLRRALGRIGQRPETVGDLFDSHELKEEITFFLRSSGEAGFGRCQ